MPRTKDRPLLVSTDPRTLCERAVKAGLKVQPGMNLFPGGCEIVIDIPEDADYVLVHDAKRAETYDVPTKDALPDMHCPGVQGMALAQLETHLHLPGFITVAREWSEQKEDWVWYGSMSYKNTYVRGCSRAEVLVLLMEVAPC